NVNSLASASARIAYATPRAVIANVLDPLPDALGTFDSIGTNYLFHCVPGTWASKGVAFEHLANRLSPDGVLFGSTILGRGVDHNRIGRMLMALYNWRGIFHNVDDDAAGLEAALRRHFTDVKVEITGTVAAYAARQPRPSSASATGGRP
ncbi:MAG: SAM-dependent methyltransferase, partial [Mycobacterium sp.]|nr:SAM-dependent methyltransferase [Mycobacterium sp.]